MIAEDTTIHVAMVSFPPFDGIMTKCCRTSQVTWHDVTNDKLGLSIETVRRKCMRCEKENPEMIPYEKE